VSGMPDEPTPEPEPAADTTPTTTPAEPAPVTTPVEPPDTGYTPRGVPTFDSVREKIETRYGASIGAAELDAESPEGRTVEEQYDARQRAAAERLDEIRKSMHKDDKETDAQ
jgi:phage shock protein A